MNREREYDIMKWLLTFYRRINYLTSGKHGHPGLTAFSRGMVLLLALGFGVGPFLLHALITMPTGLWIIILLGLGLRVALWYWRRSR